MHCRTYEPRNRLVYGHYLVTPVTSLVYEAKTAIYILAVYEPVTRLVRPAVYNLVGVPKKREYS